MSDVVGPRPVEVGIDLTGASAVSSGVRTRAEAMIRALAASPDQVRLHLTADDPWVAELAEELRLCVRVTPSSRLGRLLGTRRRVRRFVREHHLDVVQLEAPPVPRASGAPLIFSLHDIRYLDYPLRDERSAFGLYQRLGLGRWARRADRVLALTDTMRQRFIDELGVQPGRVLTVPPGRPPAASIKRDGHESGELATRYVLCLGHLEARKNLRVVVEATGEGSWPADVDVIFAGRDEGQGGRLHELASQQPRGTCRFIGPVSDEERDALLEGALAVALPSRVEGFGMVALEANAAGTPVLAARESALPEVVGTEEALLAWDDPAAWAEAVRRLAQDERWRDGILSAQRAWMERFSWDRSAELLLGVYTSLAAGEMR
jgi:glycosyltransferase involved in cell wall biosynthesis